MFQLTWIRVNATLASCIPRMHRTMKIMVVRRRLCVSESVVNTMFGVREFPVAKVKVLNISKFTTLRDT